MGSCVCQWKLMLLVPLPLFATASATKCMPNISSASAAATWKEEEEEEGEGGWRGGGGGEEIHTSWRMIWFLLHFFRFVHSVHQIFLYAFCILDMHGRNAHLCNNTNDLHSIDRSAGMEWCRRRKCKSYTNSQITTNADDKLSKLNVLTFSTHTHTPNALHNRKLLAIIFSWVLSFEYLPEFRYT